ncbi:T9SS C-terminal target domain-containing protein [Maribacter algicola]|uniref:T9SS C-terminal target domain-containing protein n=1 Tax=Maribacter algicola TaxID=2498892 RepID=A0A426RIP9_9FLAO|nr:PQQ-dependent sugar dehydrogenase [Maribacter algicola]RRQ48854.1 T9SS C-terminal target domain-containing protein [Maribacter algicola]
MRKFALGAFLIVLVSATYISFAPIFYEAGLTNPESVGPFLNGNFPDKSASDEKYQIAFPNLSFDSPLTFSTIPNTNNLIVAQQNGMIFQFENNNNVTQKNIVADLSSKVGVVWDGGFLGLAIHPEFGHLNKNYFYIYYTTKDGQERNYPDSFVSGFGCNREDYWGGFLILERISVDPNTLTRIPGEDLIMIKRRMFSSTHRGGGLTFGNDGFLYLATGDQSAYAKPQDITTNLDGGVLRLDVDQNSAKSHNVIRTLSEGGRFLDEISGIGYGIPNDNPFPSPDGSHFEEYYSIGHRNPHRMTLDKITGSIFIGEVGENRHEEINRVIAGKNYGWPVYEGDYYRGTACVGLLDGMAHESPLLTFPRSDANAIIGGYVYRGSEMSQYFGKYICADYGVGEEIWAVDPNDGSFEVITQFSPTNIISFGQDQQGELYLLSEGNNVKLYKLTQGGPFQGNLPQLLSETGAFSNLENLVPNEGLVPYDLIESFWSDGAEKKRWMVIPNDGTHDQVDEQIQFSENGNWGFPIGTVLIKHFELPLDANNPSLTKRLETRFSVKASDGSFYFVTYKWNNEETDAVLLNSGLDENIEIRNSNGSTSIQKWTYPSTQDCVACHNPATGGSLGPRTRYLNSQYTYEKTGVRANQLVTLSHLGILNQVIDDSRTQNYLTYKALNDGSATLDEKARSYLDLNCAYCHRPGGTGDRAQFDLQLFNSLQETGLLTSGINTPLGISGEKILYAGDASKSILYHRINSDDPSIMMPPIAKNKINEEGVVLIENWINQMESTSPPNPVGDCNGQLADVTEPVGSGTITSRNDFVPAEDRFKAFDNKSTSGDHSKWLDAGGVPSSASPSWIQITLPQPRRVEQLAITSANDDYGRDPKDFRLMASNGGTFEMVGSWSGEEFAQRYHKRTFDLSAPGTYTTYRLEITKNDLNAEMTQIAEIELMGCVTMETNLSVGLSASLQPESNINNASKFIIAPNPLGMDRILTLSVPQGITNKKRLQILIFTINGKLVFKSNSFAPTFGNHQFYLDETIVSGVYALQITDEKQGETFFWSKLVVK